MQSSAEIKNVIAASTGAVLTGVALHTVLTVLEKLVGDKYSPESESKLADLINLYRQTLHVDREPTNWQLNDEKRPIYCFLSHRKYERYVEEQNQHKTRIMNFNYYSWIIVETITQYLEQRKQRYIGQGRTGDLLEQFLGEWLSWAIHILPNLKYDQPCIEALKCREEYIDAIITHPTIFSRGRLNRDIEKFDVFRIIKKEISSCIRKATDEKNRLTSRDYFDTIQQNTSGLLLESLKVLYYFRSSPVYKIPLFIDDYVNSISLIRPANIVRKLYSEMKRSHTGSILYATIVQSGIDSFDLIVKNESDTRISEYLDSEFKVKPIKWDIGKADLPEWLIDEKTKLLQLDKVQKLCELICRLSAIRKLIAIAYALSGGSGDSWAYGDKKGKASVLALIKIYGLELEELHKAFVDFYKEHESLLSLYNHNNKKNFRSFSSLNFRKVSIAVKEIKKIFEVLKKASLEFSIQAVNYSADSDKILNELKSLFYTGLSHFIKTYHPDKTELFQFNLEDNEELSCVFRNVSFRTDADLRLYEISSFRYLFTRAQNGSLHCINQDNKVLFNISDLSITVKYHPNWSVGNNYGDWRTNFFERNKISFDNYNKLLDELTVSTKNRDSRSIKIFNQHIQRLSKLMIYQVNKEQPKWRLIPFTMGFPFHSKSRNFAELLIIDLKRKQGLLDIFISRTIEYLEINTGDIDRNSISDAIDRQLSNSFNSEAKQVASEAATPSSNISIISGLRNENNSAVQRKEITEDKFLLWFREFNRLFLEWQEKDMRTDFQIFSTDVIPRQLLQDCLNQKEKLKGSNKFFIDNCKDIMSTILTVTEDVNNSISDNSSKQLAIVLKLLDILVSEEQVVADKITIFETNLKLSFNGRFGSEEKHADSQSENNRPR
jgi:hypothetical protein